MFESTRSLASTLLLMIASCFMAAQSALAAPVTFAFEGEVDFFSTQRVADEFGNRGIQVGSPVHGTYTFESTAMPSGPAGQTRYADALLDYEVAIGGWNASMDPASAERYIDVWSTIDLYRLSANANETPRLIAPGSGGLNLSVLMIGAGGNPIQSDVLPIAPPDLAGFLGGAQGVLSGDGALRFLIHSLTPVVDSESLERVSRGIAPSQTVADSEQPQLSATGDKLVFRSQSGNLVAGDDNGQGDIFLRDAASGAITLVSRNIHGKAGNAGSYNGKISRDGSVVAFASSASDLVSGDINLQQDVFVFDVASGAVDRVSVDSQGNQGLAGSREPALDADGSTIAFSSQAENLVLGDGNSVGDVFIHDRTTGTTTRVSVSSFGTSANGTSDRPSLSADARYVLFDSYADNLVVGDDNDENDVFVRDRDVDADGVFDEPGAVQTVRVSVSSAGAEGVMGASYAADLSPDGRYVLFHSEAAELLPGFTPEIGQLFVHDRDADGNGLFDEPGGISTRLLSETFDGSPNYGDVEGSQISDDGRFAIFSSDSENLSPNDTPDFRDVFLIDRDTDQDGLFDEIGQTSISVLSLAPGGGPADDESGGFTSGVSMSADAGILAFESRSTNLVPDDDNGRSDIFLNSGGSNVLASTSPFGQNPNDNCETPVVSADGRFVGHGCYATNLVPNDNNQAKDVFRFDRITRTHEIASVTSTGVPANQESAAPSITDDGQRMVFESDATNLVSGDSNAQRDIFLRDFATGSTTRQSVSQGGAEGNDTSLNPSISGDGQHVAFTSYATNLVPGDTNNYRDVFVKQPGSGQIERVSVSSSGVQGDGESGAHRGYADGRFISRDGRYVAFESFATNLVAGDNNNYEDIFVRDRQAGSTRRVSVSSAGVEGNGRSIGPSISLDGRFVAFTSLSNNLVAGDNNNQWDVYVRDTVLNTTELVSVTPGGIAGNSASGSSLGGVSISADGNLVAFRSLASNLVAGDGNGYGDIFVRDRTAGETRRVNVSRQGLEGNEASRAPSMAALGGHVVFESDATSLVGDDTNVYTDLYLARLDLDSDMDGLRNEDDNCPLAANVDQADRDGDGVGDVCDNCIDVPNAAQEDHGGITSSVPDGIGTRCQCGDIQDELIANQGIVNANDPSHLLSVLVGSLNFAIAPEKCNVSGPQDLVDGDGDGLPDDCDLVDWVATQQAIAGQGSLGDQCGEMVSVPSGTIFTDELSTVFQEEKCGTCHGFTNPASGKRLAHEADGRLAPGADVTSNSTCQGCHNAGTGFSDDWRGAPSIMDWTGMSPLETCQLIKANTPSAATMADHFQNDVRILWSLDQIALDSNVWFGMADRWIQGGMRCD